MPLCPNCIVEHTQQHFLQKNKPTYLSLSQALAEVKHKCYHHIIQYEQLAKQNHKLFDYIVSLRESIHNQLQEEKHSIEQELSTIFDEYEEKLFEAAVKRYNDLQVYSRKQASAIGDYITQQIETLHNKITVLKGQNCLMGLITYYSGDGQVYEDGIKQIKEYAEKHREAGKLLVGMDPSKLALILDNFCEQNMVIEYVQQKQINNEKQNEGQNIYKKGNNQNQAGLMNKLKQRASQNGKQNKMNNSNRTTPNPATPNQTQFKSNQLIKTKPQQNKQESMPYRQK